MRRLIMGYEGIPAEMPWSVLISPRAYYGKVMPTAGEAYRAHTARTLNRMCHNQEAVVRRVCYHAVPEVQKEQNMCPHFVWYKHRPLAAGMKKRMWRVLQAVVPREEHMLATSRTCGRIGPVLVPDVDFGGAAHGTVRSVMKEGVTLEVLHVRRKDMKEYRNAGLHHAEFLRDQGAVEWGVYKWMMRRARGQKARARWDKQMRKMWKEWVAQWGIRRKKPRRGREAGAVQEKVLDGGERDKARPGILLCAPLGLKGPRGKVQSTSGQWYDVHADMFRGDNILVGAGQGDQCRECTKEAGQVPWPVLRMTAWAFATATMLTTDARGQWWGPVLRLPREVQEDEEAQGGMQVWWGEEQEGRRTGVQIGWDTMRGLHEEDDGVAVRFQMTDTGQPEEEAPIVSVGHKCRDSVRRIRLTVNGLPGDRLWYLVMVQAYLEQGRAKRKQGMVSRSAGDERLGGKDRE